MLKKILVALISAQLIIVPVKAETTERKPVQCTKGFVGVDDFFFYLAVSYLVIQGTLFVGKIAKAYNDQAKQQKPAPLTPECKL